MWVTVYSLLTNCISHRWSPSSLRLLPSTWPHWRKQSGTADYGKPSRPKLGLLAFNTRNTRIETRIFYAYFTCILYLKYAWFLESEIHVFYACFTRILRIKHKLISQVFDLIGLLSRFEWVLWNLFNKDKIAISCYISVHFGNQTGALFCSVSIWKTECIEDLVLIS